MKYLICALLAFSFLTVSTEISAQNSTRAFYKEHKRKPGVVNFKIPGWLIWLGGGMAYNSVDDPQAQAILTLGKKVKNLRLMVAEDQNPISGTDLNGFRNSLQRNDFDELIYVKSEGTEVNIIGRNRRNKLKDILILVQEEDSFVFMSMKTNLKIKHVNRVLQQLMSDVPILKSVQPKPKKKKKIPQA